MSWPLLTAHDEYELAALALTSSLVDSRVNPCHLRSIGRSAGTSGHPRCSVGLRTS